jgi:predicted dehydrogenase
VYHVDQTIWALKLGKKVFLEKPIGINFEQCKSLLNYDYKKIFIGYTYRWNPQFIKLKKDIEIGVVGKLHYANFVIGMNLEDWHPWENYQDFFMSSLELGGGALLDESHFIELVIDLFGLPEKITSIQSKISSLEIETDDYVFAQFQYKNLVVDIKLDLFKRPHESYIQVYGENGSISCDFIKKSNVTTTNKSYTNSAPSLFQFDYERNDLFVSMIKDFIYFVNSDSETARVPISRGLDVMLVIDKIRKASQDQNWVYLETF